MNDATPQQQTPEEIAELAAFNDDANRAIQMIFDHNKEMLNSGISPHALALALVLSAADLTAAVAVENGAGDRVPDMIASLTQDMTDRSKSAIGFYAANREGQVAA